MKPMGKAFVLAALVASTGLVATAPVFAQQQQQQQMQARDGSGTGNGPMMGGQMPRMPMGMDDGAMPIFEQFDTDKDGKVTAEEFDAVRKARVTGLDANGDGKISAEEFVAQEMKQAQTRIEERVKARIAAQDVDGDGMLSAEELASRDRMPADMFKRLDRDGDGAVSAAEAQAARKMMGDRMQGRMGGHDMRGKGDHQRGGRDCDHDRQGMKGSRMMQDHSQMRGQMGGRQMGDQDGWRPFFQRNAPAQN